MLKKVKPKPEAPEAKPSGEYLDRGFKIVLPDPFTGHDHGVDFAHGTGVMCMLGFSYCQPEWVVYEDGIGWKRDPSYKFDIFEPLLDFFKNIRCAAIKEIDIAEAEKLLEKVRGKPESFAPKTEEPKEDKKAKEPKADKAEKKEKLPHEKS